MANRKSLLLALALVFSLYSKAQTEPQTAADYRKMIFGIKGVTNFSWFKADSRNLEKGGMKLGFGYGLMGDYNFNENYAASFEFLISKLNGRMTFKDSLTYSKDGIAQPKSFNVEYEYSNRYIQIPLSIKFRTKEIGYIKYYAQFGLAPAIRITSKTKINGTRLPWSEEDRTDIKTNEDADEIYEPAEFDDDVRFINLPLIVGGGIEYNLSANTSIYLNLRYENGFTNILKSKSTTIFNKNVSVALGVFF